MSGAAAAAAKAAAVTAAKSLAAKQLSNALDTVDPLAESSFHKFQQQMLRVAHSCDWDATVLEGEPREGEDGNIAPDTPKHDADVRIAYELIMTKTDGHPVEHKLEAVEVGDSAEAWRIVVDHFVQNTARGRRAANQDFYFTTMESTDSDLLEWSALCRRNSKNYALTGGQPTEADLITVFLGGLLREFEHIKDIVESSPDLANFQAVVAAIEDYARPKGLLTLKRSSGTAKSRTFVVDGTILNPNRVIPAGIDPKEECKMWGQNRCRYGDRCYRIHRGPGGVVKNANKKQKPNPSAAGTAPATCSLCHAQGHVFRHCPQAVCLTCQAGGHVAADCPSPVPHGQRPSAPPPRQSGQASSSNFVGAAPISGQGSTSNYVDLPAAYSFAGYTSTSLPMEDSAWEDRPEQGIYSWLALLGATVFGLLTMMATAFTSWPAGLAYWTVAILGAVYTFGGQRTQSESRVLGFLVLLLAISFLTTAAAAPCQHTGQSFVAASSYLNTDGTATVPDQYQWCADTGTNRFVTNDINDYLPDSIRHNREDVAVGGGVVTSPCVGTVRVRSLDYNHVVECNNVLFLPTCAKKLMPAYQFLNQNCEMILRKGEVHLRDKNKSNIFSGKEIGGLYYYRTQTVHASSLNSPKEQPKEINSTTLFGLPVGKHISAKSQDFGQQLLEAHWAYGHLHFDKLRKMFGLKKGDDPECPACTIAKQKQKALSDHPHTRSTRPCHRMYMDIGFTAGSRFVFQLCVDDYTRESFIDVIESKTEILPKWVELKGHLENDYQPWKFAFIKTDMEPIYWTPAWEQHCREHNLIHEFSSAYKHGQLGVPERAMQTIGISFRCMMITGNAPEKHIPHALRYANVIRNHSPTTANKGLTPLEKKAGRKLPINKRLLQAPLFCLCFSHVYEDQRAKHGRRGVACVYLGYDPVNNTYLVMEWESGREYYCADVEFFPNVFPYRSNPKQTVGSLNRFDDLAPHSTDLISESDAQEIRRSVRQRGYSISGGIPLSEIPDVDNPPDPAVLIVHKWGPDPETYEEAMGMHDADEWVLADLAEHQSWKAREVYDVVLRTQATSRGKRIFKFKEVFKRKFNPPDDQNPNGSLDKHKVRVTIAAYTKSLIEGIDYPEKNASTVRWNSTKLLFAIAVALDLDLALLDIETFFLYGILKEEVYMEFPDRWEENGQNSQEYVYLLKRSVYGWPAAPNAAQKKLKEVFTTGDFFRPTVSDDCVYTATDSSSGLAFAGTWVDDLTTVGDPLGIQKVIDTLEKTFKITVKRNPTTITSVQVERDREKRWGKFHQCDYTTTLLEEYQMLHSRPVDTPMDPATAKSLMLLPQDEFSPESIKKFQGLLGKLMWLNCRTRPDLDFVVNLLSRFVRCASFKHYELARNRVLRYLNGTRSLGVAFFAGEKGMKLIGSSDADLAGDLNSARTVLSSHVRFGDFGTVHSSCSLERKICTSTGQAETYSFSRLLKEIIWERKLLQELGFPQTDPTPCYTDNDGVVIQSTKMVNHAAAKHYRISQAFIRQVCSEGIATALPIDTHSNCSDIGTKALTGTLFLRHRAAIMGPQSPADLPVSSQRR